MSCINFAKNQKNNIWRKVKLDKTYEETIQKYFGVDSESSMDTLLQNNLTLFDWVLRNQGFPYFVGRRINGSGALTKDEADFIGAKGSKVIPILKYISELDGKKTAQTVIAIIEQLGLGKEIPVFVEVDHNKVVSSDYIKDYVKTILERGYIPGFYADTDSFYDFDRQYSRAYQSDVELMKQCKIWALSPEMEEFRDTQNSHTEKPDFWGPFVPSCISKEEIMIWQYGKKTHPVKAYDGSLTSFNLNLCAEPCFIFDVKNAETISYNLNKDKIFKMEACVTDGQVIESVSLNFELIKVQSNNLLVKNKTYAHNISSDHKILELTICQNNDLLSPEYTVKKGFVLIKLAFISNENSCAFSLKMLVSLEECDALRRFLIEECTITDDDCEILHLSKKEMWCVNFLRQNCEKTSGITHKIQENSNVNNIKNYIYRPNENVFETELISPLLARSNIIGDTYNVFATIPQDAVKSPGWQCCTIKDSVSGYPSAAYFKDTEYYYTNCYISVIAIWNLNPTIQPNASNANGRLVEFEYKKAYNAFVYYYPQADEIRVVFCEDDESYVVTSQTQISINLVGCHTAHVDRCSFEVCEGGHQQETVDYTGYIVGFLGGRLSQIADVYNVLSDVLDIITNYTMDQAKKEYVFYPQNNLVVKRVGSTYSPILMEKNSLLKIRCTLDNVNVYPTSRIYCQVRTSLVTLAGETEYIYMGGSIPLK